MKTFNQINQISIFITFLVICACNSQKSENIDKLLPDIEVQIIKLDINDSTLSDLILIWGTVELKANYDSIKVSLDTLINKRKKDKYHQHHYTDSVKKLICVRNIELIFKKKSYGSAFDTYDPSGLELFEELPKGNKRTYYFKTYYHDIRVFDSVSFEIDYIKNGKMFRKSVGKHLIKTAYPPQSVPDSI